MCVCVYARARAIFSHVRLFAAPGDCQAPLSMGLSRQEYWSGLLCFPQPGALPNPGTEPTSLASPALGGRFFTTDPHGKLFTYYTTSLLSITQKQPGERYAQGKVWAKGMVCHSLQSSTIPPTWKLSEPNHLEFDGVILDI